MAAFRTGDVLAFPLGPLLDASGNPLTGKAAFWSALTARKPDGTSFAPTYTELSNGSYLATVTSDQRGAWFLVSRYRETGQDDYVDATTVTVDDAAPTPPDPLAAQLPGAYAPGTAGANIAALTPARAAKLDLISPKTPTRRWTSVEWDEV